MMHPVITDLDARRLRSLLETPIARRTPFAARLLEDKLRRARIVPAAGVPAGIVTMNARAWCSRTRDREEREVTLVYPWASAPESARISILTAAGVELLAATAGDRLALDSDGWRIVQVTFQPEAERLFHL